MLNPAQASAPAPTAAPTTAGSAPPPSSGGGTPSRPQGRWLGSAIGGAANIVGSLVGSNANKEIAESNKPLSPFEFWVQMKEIQRDQMKDSHYKDFAEFQSQMDAKLERDKLNTMFPELNPWELAGVPTASPTTTANAPAMDITKSSTQNQTTAAVAQASNQTTLQMGMINAAKDMAIARLNSETSIENNKSSVEAQNKLVDPQIAKIEADIQTAAVQRDVSTQNIQNLAQGIVESKARTEGIALTSVQTAAQTRYVEQQIEQSRAQVRALDATGYKTMVDADLSESLIRNNELTSDKIVAETDLTKQKTHSDKYGRGSISSEAYSLSNAAADAVRDTASSIDAWLSSKYAEIKAQRDGIGSRANTPPPTTSRH